MTIFIQENAFEHVVCKMAATLIGLGVLMETISALLVLYAGNSPVTGEFPSQRPVTLGFDEFCDLRLNKRLSKHTKQRWFETPSRSLWRYCNE